MLEPTEILRETARMSFRNRSVLHFLIPSLVLDVVLTVGIGYANVRLHTVTSAAEQESCHFGNIYRLKEKRLWEYVIIKTEPVHLTPAQVVAYDELQIQLDHAMQLRNCKTL